MARAYLAVPERAMRVVARYNPYRSTTTGHDNLGSRNSTAHREYPLLQEQIWRSTLLTLDPGTVHPQIYDDRTIQPLVENERSR